MWDLKRNNKEPHITWTIVCKVYGIPKRIFCKLCLKEKLLIIRFPNQDILLKKVLNLSVNADMKIKI